MVIEIIELCTNNDQGRPRISRWTGPEVPVGRRSFGGHNLFSPTDQEIAIDALLKVWR